MKAPSKLKKAIYVNQLNFPFPVWGGAPLPTVPPFTSRATGHMSAHA